MHNGMKPSLMNKWAILVYSIFGANIWAWRRRVLNLRTPSLKRLGHCVGLMTHSYLKINSSKKMRVNPPPSWKEFCARTMKNIAWRPRAQELTFTIPNFSHCVLFSGFHQVVEAFSRINDLAGQISGIPRKSHGISIRFIRTMPSITFYYHCDRKYLST